MDFGSGDGWNTIHEIPQTHSQQVLGDKLPFPVSLATLDEKLSNSSAEHVEVGDYHFRTVQTVGVIMEITKEDGKITYLLHDPEDTDKTFHVVQFGDVEEGASKYIEANLAEDVRVRVIGKLKNIGEEKTILAYLIQKLSDDKDYEIFKLEAEAGYLFFEKRVIEKIRNEEANSWQGMLAPPQSRFHAEFISAKAISSPQTPKTPANTVRKREEPSPTSVTTPVVPTMPSNPHLRNIATVNVSGNVHVNTVQNQSPVTPKSSESSATPAASSSSSGSLNSTTPKPSTGLPSKLRGLIRQEERFLDQNDEYAGVTFQKLLERAGNVPAERLKVILREMEDGGVIYCPVEEKYRILENA